MTSATQYVRSRNTLMFANIYPLTNQYETDDKSTRLRIKEKQHFDENEGIFFKHDVYSHKTI